MRCAILTCIGAEIGQGYDQGLDVHSVEPSVIIVSHASVWARSEIGFHHTMILCFAAALTGFAMRTCS